MMLCVTTLIVLCCLDGVLAGCPNTAGVVLGSIFGTLVVVAVVIGIMAFFYYRRNKKDKNKLQLNQEKLKQREGHDNPTFMGDVEMGGVKKNGQPSANKAKDFPGYVECREYESPIKNRQVTVVAQNGAGVPRSLFLEDGAPLAGSKARPVHKTASSGSLDNSYPAMDPNIIVVPLLSQDIMGLGFNVDGNMKEGIFVSKLHKRGPAHDTGLISVGDRIMNVTVSFENMVLEDAMTILSYASPYPVKLCLQRPGSPTSRPSNPEAKVTHSEEAEDVDINHPVYRSQSLDDLHQISKEGLLHPRRTWSEWKRSGYVPNKPVEEGRLKKWKGKTDIVEETSESGDLQTQSSASNYSIPDLKININDLRMDSDDADVPVVCITEAEVNSESKADSVTAGGSDVVAEVQIEEAKSGMNSAPESLDPDVSVSPNEAAFADENVISPADDADKATGDEMPDDDISVSVPTEKPPAIPVGDDQSPDGDSMTALVGSPEQTNCVDGQDGGDEGAVSDVIRDYFSNSPTILEQFGLTPNTSQQTSADVNSIKLEVGADDAEAKQTSDGIAISASGRDKSDVIAGSPDSGFMGTQVSGDGELPKAASSNSSTSSASASPSHGDEGVSVEIKKSALISRKVGGDLALDVVSSGFNEVRKEEEAKQEAKSGPKGGVAYYVSIDDHGAPSHAIRPIAGVDLSTMDFGQPELIRPKSSGDSSTLIQAATSVNSYEAVRAESEGKASTDENDNSASPLNMRVNKLTVQLDGNDSGISSLSSAVSKEYKIERSENVTIIRQNEIPEAFTVTLNREDSEA